mmetsp:Transcript_16307/g.33133  ORF Transcript_16307/g.33133 Transcript_16307/m.33133 type:complete len:314 (+) Transcript_16307:71-1012(+)
MDNRIVRYWARRVVRMQHTAKRVKHVDPKYTTAAESRMGWNMDWSWALGPMRNIVLNKLNRLPSAKLMANFAGLMTISGRNKMLRTINNAPAAKLSKNAPILSAGVMFSRLLASSDKPPRAGGGGGASASPVQLQHCLCQSSNPAPTLPKTPMAASIGKKKTKNELNPLNVSRLLDPDHQSNPRAPAKGLDMLWSLLKRHTSFPHSPTQIPRERLGKTSQGETLAQAIRSSSRLTRCSVEQRRHGRWSELERPSAMRGVLHRRGLTINVIAATKMGSPSYRDRIQSVGGQTLWRRAERSPGSDEARVCVIVFL